MTILTTSNSAMRYVNRKKELKTNLCEEIGIWEGEEGDRNEKKLKRINEWKKERKKGDRKNKIIAKWFKI